MLHDIFLAIDTFNNDDPDKIMMDGQYIAGSVLYSHRMRSMQAQFCPDASDDLSIAIYAQHIGRWMIKRTDFEPNRAGYLTWRKKLAQLHADKVAEVLQPFNFNEARILHIQAVIQKKNFKTDPDAQTLEDVACLVFLNFYFDEFAKKHDEEKLIHILSRSWKKMSEKGRQFALQHIDNPQLGTLLEKVKNEKVKK